MAFYYYKVIIGLNRLLCIIIVDLRDYYYLGQPDILEFLCLKSYVCMYVIIDVVSGRQHPAAGDLDYRVVLCGRLIARAWPDVAGRRLI